MTTGGREKGKAGCASEAAERVLAMTSSPRRPGASLPARPTCLLRGPARRPVHQQEVRPTHIWISLHRLDALTRVTFAHRRPRPWAPPCPPHAIAARLAGPLRHEVQVARSSRAEVAPWAVSALAANVIPGAGHPPPPAAIVADLASLLELGAAGGHFAGMLMSLSLPTGRLSISATHRHLQHRMHALGKGGAAGGAEPALGEFGGPEVVVVATWSLRRKRGWAASLSPAAFDGVNPIYCETIKALHTFPRSVVIACGRLSSSSYFVISHSIERRSLGPEAAVGALRVGGRLAPSWLVYARGGSRSPDFDGHGQTSMMQVYTIPSSLPHRRHNRLAGETSPVVRHVRAAFEPRVGKLEWRGASFDSAPAASMMLLPHRCMRVRDGSGGRWGWRMLRLVEAEGRVDGKRTGEERIMAFGLRLAQGSSLLARRSLTLACQRDQSSMHEHAPLAEGCLRLACPYSDAKSSPASCVCAAVLLTCFSRRLRRRRPSPTLCLSYATCPCPPLDAQRVRRPRHHLLATSPVPISVLPIRGAFIAASGCRYGEDAVRRPSRDMWACTHLLVLLGFGAGGVSLDSTLVACRERVRVGRVEVSRTSKTGKAVACAPALREHAQGQPKEKKFPWQNC
ncbi:hypothetical protein B0H19DRAFT_1253787 [Mycena capillaripes]|nr:hypothetical protein B0H19DRAFT_1253787 [Mycena capillaripes]